MWQGAIRILALVLGLVIATAGAAAQVGPGDGAPVEPETAWSDAPLVLARLDELPPAPAFVGVARLTFPPGAVASGGRLAGPRLFLVESGSLTVLADGAAILTRATATSGATPPAAEHMAPGTATTLQAGDRLVVPAGPPRELANNTRQAAVFLDVAIFATPPEQLAPFTTEAGIVFQPLAVGTAEAMPATPARVAFGRVMIDEDERLTPPEISGPQLLYVESGTINLVAIDGTVGYSRAAAPTAGSTAGAMRAIAPGSAVVLTAGASALIQAGAVIALHNPVQRPVTLLRLTVAPDA